MSTCLAVAMARVLLGMTMGFNNNEKWASEHCFAHVRLANTPYSHNADAHSLLRVFPRPFIAMSPCTAEVALDSKHSPLGLLDVLAGKYRELFSCLNDGYLNRCITDVSGVCIEELGEATVLARCNAKSHFKPAAAAAAA